MIYIESSKYKTNLYCSKHFQSDLKDNNQEEKVFSNDETMGTSTEEIPPNEDEDRKTGQGPENVTSDGNRKLEVGTKHKGRKRKLKRSRKVNFCHM